MAGIAETSTPVTSDSAGVPFWQLLGLLAAIALFHLYTMRPGHPWADDFALYVLHARNLVEGRSYADTGYVYNPSDPWHSPRVYPPGFPLLLAPVYALFGLNLFALRLIVIASLVAGVAAFAALVRPLLSPRLVLVAVAMVGFQPYFIQFKNLLLPDFSFMFAVMLSLYLLRRLHEQTGRSRNEIVTAVIGGAVLAFALSFRTIGVTLFSALALFHLLRWKRPSRTVLICLATAVALYAVQTLVMPPASGYVAQVTDAAPPVLRQPALLMRLRRIVELFAFTDVMWNGISWAVTLILMCVTALLSVVGYVSRLRRLSVLETFVISYVGVLVIFPYAAARYLLPIIPFIIAYALIGLVRITAWLGAYARKPVIVLGTVVASTYAFDIVFVDRSEFVNGVAGRQAVQAFDYVRTCVPSDALIASRRPRAVALFTGRKAISASRRQVNEPALYTSFVDEAGVDYVVTFRYSRLDVTTATSPAGFVRVFLNDRFVVYRNGSSGTAPVSPGCGRTSADAAADAPVVVS